MPEWTDELMIRLATGSAAPDVVAERKRLVTCAALDAIPHDGRLPEEDPARLPPTGHHPPDRHGLPPMTKGVVLGAMIIQFGGAAASRLHPAADLPAAEVARVMA